MKFVNFGKLTEKDCENKLNILAQEEMILKLLKDIELDLIITMNIKNSFLYIKKLKNIIDDLYFKIFKKVEK